LAYVIIFCDFKYFLKIIIVYLLFEMPAKLLIVMIKDRRNARTYVLVNQRKNIYKGNLNNTRETLASLSTKGNSGRKERRNKSICKFLPKKAIFLAKQKSANEPKGTTPNTNGPSPRTYALKQNEHGGSNDSYLSS
jgi:hypothetical protein